ncbi:centrosomal protein of 170 kDa isoform X1 [Scophthalmus maximus]|uniref:centrosomal protein of 170 kDa isoform X1 n=1 Tax=Scophthalmus maximus TaxID=52904 RepID=UPI0015E1162C|nr:centrosomal protein of 170 kDa isoform X1 [Scophthalmus maximus]XP_035494236.1 centrosomal protein of 170 kDa isoform X1 [Scophthalmus maximus]XP_047190074.1 centrosomal protein of 170 kDa isoform X1 [Scophthalmus maximus]XP_047190075.1 centrosomal protein of 170 kDa isoform X1 [Scophthalmus maximus]
MSLTSWFLVSGGGTRHRLPREMIFVGRDDCELMLQSRSVDKQHAVINYEPNTDEHKVKDLGSLNGTFVNDVRILEQIYVTLKLDDKLRFGYDTNLFTVVRGELHIPEEALKHEKYSSQLQLNKMKPPGGETSKSEVKPSEAAAAVCEATTAKPTEASKAEDKTAGDVAVLHRGTPLYGQPAWWGDGDNDGPGRPEEKSSDHTKKSAEFPQSAPQIASSQEPSYFEIPTKSAPPAGKLSDEAPSREQDAGSSAAAEPVHGHASFTIEFDPGASGKVTVKDRGAKVGPETRPRPKRPVGEELSPLQTAMVAAEVKVADWLAQNELPLALKEAVAEEDGESVKSDVPVHLRSLKGSKHEDGTQSDSENALGEQRRAAALDERSWVLWGGAGMKIREGRANVPEGLFAEEDSPARRRKSSTSKVTGGFVERRRGSAPQEQSGRNECQHHGDDYSDRGTYTIELENGDHEEEEARKMIDKVFGVDEQEAVCVSRLGGADQRERLTSQRSGTGHRGKPGRMEPEALSEELVVGGPRWVSQWATLAASHIRTDPEGSGGESHIMVTEDRAEISESSHSASFASSGYTERKRRTLPQLPGEELALGRRTPGSGLRTEMGEKQDTELQEKENQQEKMARGKHRPGHGTGGVGSRGGSPGRSSPAKSQDSGGGRSAQSGVLAKLPPRPLTSGEKRMEEARRRKKEEERARESGGKPLLRQESFTVEKPSSNVPIELRPRIDALTGSRPQSRETGVDSVALQKDSEAVAAFLETTVSDQGDPPSQSIEGSMSPESDVDTTSTVSQAEGARKVVQRRRTLAGQQKEKTVVCSSSKWPTGGRESQDRRVKTRTSGPPPPSRPWTSLDLTDDDINSNSLLSDSQPTSTQDSRSSHTRAQTGSTTVGASTKSSRAKTTQAPACSVTSKTSVAPKPRPTRASLLRRARLGDSSDTEPADLDRMSVASEASTASSTSRTGMARRGMSRIEALAQPRRPRVGSPSAQSDSEATVTRSRGLGARSVAGDYAMRQGPRGPNATLVSGPRARANSASKLPDKSKGCSVTPASGTRWRRVPVEYASTSEDEYGSNRHMSKQGQTKPFPSTRVAQLGGSAPATPNPTGLTALKQHSREQDEYMRDWTAHSEEIARISQDLAKDLAMLAREIHDVAGEIDSVSPAATDPGALLEESVFVDNVDVGGAATEQSGILATNGRSVELRSRSSRGQGSRSIRRQTWNRDDAVLDSLLIASVTQLSARIRQSVDKTSCKIRILFKDRERKWEEIENKLQAEHDSLVLKSSNKEISTIIQDLKRVERQLLVIDMMVDPDGILDALPNLGLTSPLADQRTGPGTQQQALVLHPGAEASSCTLSAPRPEGLTSEPRSSTEL